MDDSTPEKPATTLRKWRAALERWMPTLRRWTAPLRQVADNVSTRPNRVSWKWKGGSSYIALTLLYAMYLGRLLSLLQWVKYFYRTIVRRMGRASVDKASKRVNVPSCVVELYFLAWLGLLLLLPKCCSFTQALSAYFIFESYVWILYYYFFRRFFEERYAIMHTLEYIVILPVMIVSQALAVAAVEGMAPVEAMVTILNPFAGGPLYVVLLSVLYSAIIFGLIISNLPVERVKEAGNYKFNYTIIGHGDVVRNRLLPALCALGTEKLVAVFDPAHARPEHFRKGCASVSLLSDGKGFDKLVLSSCIVWIATPSYVHISYLSRFASEVDFLVMEKPITSLRPEFEVARRLLEKYPSKIFCLSYYYLEKALPLTFLYNPLAFYEKYLDFHEVPREEVLAAFSHLGRAKRVELCLFEGEDRREWLTDMRYGGQYLETFIHLAMILRMIAGEAAASPTDCRWDLRDSRGRKATYVGCEGLAGPLEFDLKMAKFWPENKRGGTIRYERGSIAVDFERQSVTLTDTDENRSYTLSTAEPYAGKKYAIQLDMVETCFQEGILPALVDGSELQLKTLEWLFSVDLSAVEHTRY